MSTYRKIAYVIITSIASLSILLLGCARQEKKKWALVWADEFDTQGLPDASKWNYESGFVRNGEAQYYTNRSENCRIENGTLVLEAHQENYVNGSDTANYTSASLITLHKQSFLYGRLEVRAKMTDGNGSWPAIWLLGENIDTVPWPLCGEIDIMEYVGYDPGKVHANIHTAKYNHGLKTNKGDSTLVNNPSEEFHVYAIEWTEQKIDFLVDSTLYFSFENDRKGNPETWPFDKPHYLILNLAIGGGWGGRKGISNEYFPHKFTVDYVRYYN